MLFTAAPAWAQITVLDPKGPVAAAQRDIFYTALALMAIVVVPVFVMTIFVVWKYGAGRKSRDYRPRWDKSNRLELLIWGAPVAVTIAIGSMLWTATQKLDPYRQVGTGEPLTVQVVALDWKWLFIYPEADTASVNTLVIPARRPLRFEITSATVTNSFFIPGLGGQVYAMSGSRTELNLLADAPGRLWGRNAQFSGKDFPKQSFPVDVLESTDFQAWLRAGQEGWPALDAEAYGRVARPGTLPAGIRFSGVEPGLFNSVIATFRPPGAS